MELARLIWNSEMNCIFDIVDHQPIPPLIAMVVELNSLAHGLDCKKGGLAIQRHGEIKSELQDELSFHL